MKENISTAESLAANPAIETVPYNHSIGLNSKAILVWFAVSLFACFQFCTQVIAGPMTRELMETFNLSAVTVSYAVSSFFYAYLLMQIPAGIMLDRYSNRYLVSITCFICAAGCVLMGMANNLTAFIIARMICGLGSAFGFIGTMRVLRNYFPMRYIALFIGFTETLGFLSTATCENLVSYYLPITGYKPILLALGWAGVIISGFIFIAMHKKLSPDYELAPATKNANILADLRQLLVHRELWLLGLIAFSFFSLVTAFSALWGVPSLVNIHKLSLTASTQAISSIFVGIAVGGPLMGYLGTKIKNRAGLMTWCGLMSAMLMLFIIELRTPSLLTLALLLFTCGVLCCCYLMCFAIANELTPARLSGTAMGLLNMITMASALVMQPVMGYLVALHGPIDTINGAPIYTIFGYKRACLALVFLFLVASALSTRLSNERAA